MEGDIAEGALAEVLAIDPDFAVLVDAIEFDGDLAVLVDGGEAEVFAVPAHAGGGVAAGPAAGLGLGEGAFDAPIVGEIESAPGAVGEGGLVGAGGVGLEEFPVEVEGVADAGGLRRLGGGVERGEGGGS